MLDPQGLWDREAEAAVIGAALLDAAAADGCVAMLRPEAFYGERHRRIWAQVRGLRAKRAGCDALTVADALQHAGDLEACGGMGYLTDLIAAMPTTANATEYAAMVVMCHERREIARGANRAAALAADPRAEVADAREALAAAQRWAAEAAAGAHEAPTLDVLALNAMQSLERIADGEREAGVSTGLLGLDAALGGGLHRGELTLLGGRPSHGKSALAQQIAHAVAREGGRVLYASAEMGEDGVGVRALALESGVDSRRVRGAPPPEPEDWDRLGAALGALGQCGGRVTVDATLRSVESIADQARRCHSRGELTLVVVDHLQHLRSPRGADNRNQALGAMAMECKSIAISLGCCVLALSQLRRPEPGTSRAPGLSSLRDSGELDQIADVVLLLHRLTGDEDPPPTVDLDLVIAKNRDGRTGTLRIQHHRPTGRFRDAIREAHRA